MLHQIVVVLMINFTKLSQNIFYRGFVDISGSDLHIKKFVKLKTIHLFFREIEDFRKLFFREIEDYLET